MAVQAAAEEEEEEEPGVVDWEARDPSGIGCRLLLRITLPFLVSKEHLKFGKDLTTCHP